MPHEWTLRIIITYGVEQAAEQKLASKYLNTNMTAQREFSSTPFCLYTAAAGLLAVVFISCVTRHRGPLLSPVNEIEIKHHTNNSIHKPCCSYKTTHKFMNVLSFQVFPVQEKLWCNHLFVVFLNQRLIAPVGCTRCRALGYCSIECRDEANWAPFCYESEPFIGHLDAYLLCDKNILCLFT